MSTSSTSARPTTWPGSWPRWRPYAPGLRGAPAGLPFQWCGETLDCRLNLALTTTIGPIDLLGEIAGGGTYEQLLPDTDEVRAFGITCRCVTLGRLIHLKRSAGRVKDLEVIAELEALREERGSG